VATYHPKTSERPSRVDAIEPGLTPGGLVQQLAARAPQQQDFSTTVEDDPPAPRRDLDVGPVLEAAGWVHPEPLALPASRAERGTLVRFVTLSARVAGESTLGGELELLYTPAAIGRSALVRTARLALGRDHVRAAGPG
jgi:hypothetical protein